MKTGIAGLSIWLFLAPTFFSAASSRTYDPVRAQRCNPAHVSYIVRDENGQVLDEAKLKSIGEQLPNLIGDAQTSVGEVSFADDGNRFYWQDSVDWAKGKKVPALSFFNIAECEMRLTEATLTYQNKTMRLIFNIQIARVQHDRRPVIDSLPFQDGTFELDLSDWTRDEDKVIPAERWKKVKGSA